MSGKNFGWQLPAETDGYDLLCVTLKIPDNLEYRAAFMGAIHMLEVWFNWEKTGDTRGALAAAYWRQLLDDYLVVHDSEDCGEMAFLLRQSPTNSCLLEQSIDGGENWTTAFDYSKCIPPALQTTMETVINNSTWVSPFTPAGTFTNQPGYDDTQREAAYQALCYAVGALVESMASAAYRAKQGEVTQETIAAVALGIAAAILDAFDVLTFGALTPLCIAITGAALAALAAITALSADVWLDADNLQALKCLALKNLTNASVDLVSFQAAFTHADCLTSTQQSMAAIFTTMLANVAYAQHAYENYLNTNGNANAAAQAGILSASCVCDDTTWCFDFTPDSFPGWQWGGDVEATCGNVLQPMIAAVQTVGGVKVWKETATTGNGAVAVKWQVYIPANAVCTTGLMYYDAGDDNGDHTAHKRVVNGVETCTQPFTPYPCGVFSGQTYSGVTLNIELGLSNNQNVRNQYIEKLRLQGTGVNPFVACDNC